MGHTELCEKVRHVVTAVCIRWEVNYDRRNISEIEYHYIIPLPQNSLWFLVHLDACHLLTILCCSLIASNGLTNVLQPTNLCNASGVK